MPTKPSTKQPTVRFDELKSDVDKVSRLATRPGGVRVVDDKGAERFTLWIPSEPLPE